MRNNKTLISFFILWITWLVSVNVAHAAGAPQNDPVAMLRYIGDNMLSELKSNKATLKTKPQMVYHLAYQYVVPYADLGEMSKRVIPPQVWNTASSAQRLHFQKEFTTTVIRTYASALSAYKDQSVRFFPVRGGTQHLKTVEVDSQIDSSESQPIRVSYRLVRNGSVWKLYDMSVEGVDMLESFRAQFADILASGNMDQLLQRLSSHNAG